MIKCTKCLLEKDLINFPVEKNGRIRNQCKKCRNVLVRKWQLNNKDKIKILTKRYYETNKNKVLFSAIERKYGITEVQYNEMLMAKLAQNPCYMKVGFHALHFHRST